MAGKHYQDADVHAATLSRLRLVFRNFERVCVAFSGGKDSSVTLQLALDVARELGRSPVDVLFIDLEGQYQATIDHVSEMLGRPDVRPWWVCLPLNLRNASSLEEFPWRGSQSAGPHVTFMMIVTSTDCYSNGTEGLGPS